MDRVQEFRVVATTKERLRPINRDQIHHAITDWFGHDHPATFTVTEVEDGDK